MDYTKVKIRDILLNPHAFLGKKVIIKGEFRGWKIPKNILGPKFSGPPITRSDWIVSDGTGWIYVSASGETRVANPFSDIGICIVVYGEVAIKELDGVDVPYILPEKTELC